MAWMLSMAFPRETVGAILPGWVGEAECILPQRRSRAFCEIYKTMFLVY